MSFYSKVLEVTTTTQWPYVFDMNICHTEMEGLATISYKVGLHEITVILQIYIMKCGHFNKPC